MVDPMLLRSVQRASRRVMVLVALIGVVLLALVPSFGAVAAPAPSATHASSAGAALPSGPAALHELPVDCSPHCLAACTVVPDGCAVNPGPRALSGRTIGPSEMVVMTRVRGADGLAARARSAGGAPLAMLGVDRR